MLVHVALHFFQNQHCYCCLLANSALSNRDDFSSSERHFFPNNCLMLACFTFFCKRTLSTPAMQLGCPSFINVFIIFNEVHGVGMSNIKKLPSLI